MRVCATMLRDPLISARRMSKICGSNPKLVTQGSHGHCLPQWKNGRERKACVGLDRIQVPTMKQAGVGMPPPVLTRLSNWSRSEEHTSELQSLMRISYAVFCLKKKK